MLTVPRKLFKKDIKKLIKIFDTDQKYLIPDKTNQRAKYQNLSKCNYCKYLFESDGELN